MPYRIQWEEKGAVVSFSGIHSLLEDNKASGELFSNSRMRKIKYVIWDLSEVYRSSMLKNSTKLTAEYDAIRSNEWTINKVVFVARDKQLKDLCINYIHNFMAVGSLWKFYLAETIGEARKWIDSN